MSLLTRLSTVSRFSRTASPALARGMTTIVNPANSQDSASAHAHPAAGAAADVRPHHVVMSISGRDKTGIVKSVSAAVTEYEANLEESKMAILGGDFAMIVYVSMKHADDADRMASRLRTELPSFTISLRETTPPAESSQEVAPALWSLSMEGPDNPGIVAAISEALAVHGCNVREMETETTTAPFAGYEIFKLNSRVNVDEAKLDELATALDKVEEQYGSTISLSKEN